MCSFLCWAICGATISPVGIIFLGVLGILCAKESPLVEIETNIKKDRAKSSFIAVGIYLLIFIICTLYLIFRSTLSKKKQNNDPMDLKKKISEENIEPPISTPGESTA